MLTPFAFQQIGTVEASLPVANPALWLDASRSDTLFVENTLVTPVTTDNGPVGGWKDLSGNNRHALQSGTNRPTWRTPINGQNGLGVMSFNGSTQYFDVASLPSLASGYTFYGVFKQPTVAGSVLSSASAGVAGSTAAMIAGPAVTAAGNAQISTSSPQYGTGSAVFDGTTNTALIIDGSTGRFAFGTGPFTVEFWIYPTNITARQGIYSNNLNGASGSGTGPVLAIRGAGTTGVIGVGNVGVPDTVQTGANAIVANAWQHVALVREGTGTNQSKIYVNGLLAATGTISDNFSANRDAAIGRTIFYSEYFTGKIDDLRITKYARYTSAFTPSAVPLPDTPATDPYFAQTSLLLHMDGANGSTVFTDASNNIGTGITQGGRSIAQPVASGTVVGVIGNYDGTHTAGNYFVRTSSSAANVSGVMTQTASTPATGTASIGRLTNATAYFNSQIYELVVLPRQSNGTEDQAWKDYTTAKWGITWS